MKFSDGLWLNKKGYQHSYAAQAYEVAHTENIPLPFLPPQPHL